MHGKGFGEGSDSASAGQFWRVPHGPQEFDAPGEAGRFLTRQSGRNGIALGQQPGNPLGLPSGGLMIGEAPEPAASARVIADLKGRVPVAVHGAGAAIDLHRGVADADRFDPALWVFHAAKRSQNVGRIQPTFRRMS